MKKRQQRIRRIRQQSRLDEKTDKKGDLADEKK